MSDPADELKTCANDVRLNYSNEVVALKNAFDSGLVAIKKKILKERSKLYDLNGKFF